MAIDLDGEEAIQRAAADDAAPAISKVGVNGTNGVAVLRERFHNGDGGALGVLNGGAKMTAAILKARDVVREEAGGIAQEFLALASADYVTLRAYAEGAELQQMDRRLGNAVADIILKHFGDFEKAMDERCIVEMKELLVSGSATVATIVRLIDDWIRNPQRAGIARATSEPSSEYPAP